MDLSFWDLLLINDSLFENEIRRILCKLNIPEERYVFLQREINEDEISFYRTLFREDTLGGVYIDYISRKRGQNYLSVTTNGGEYITYASDRTISKDMFFQRLTFSQNEIDLFIALTKQYYGTLETTKGFFFDIGANIGTTCIYAKKYLLPNISIAAFEPLYKNFKLLQANMILNDIPEYFAVNKAVSDKSSSYEMKYNATNPASSSIVEWQNDIPSSDFQLVDSISIDEFLVQNHISPEDVRYVWIDTEGFEFKVLNGAKLLLQQKKTAFYLEYAPCTANIERLTNVADQCRQYFTSFICIDDYFTGDIYPHPIDDLYELYKKHPHATNIFLIK